MNAPNFANNLGNIVQLSQSSRVINQYGMLGAQGDFVEVFDTRHDSNALDGQLRQYCIQTYLGGYTLPTSELPRKLAILGKIRWGIGGAIMEADFDWKIGNQISIAASFVRIVAAYSEIDSVNEESPPLVSVGAMLSTGGRAARSQVTRTFPRLAIDVNNPVVFPVPPFAHALNLFSAQPAFYTAANSTITYLGGASAGFSAVSTDLVNFVSDGVPFLQALASEDGVRFPEATKFVQLTTTSESSLFVTPCFTLNF